ncbi:hypothetical protein HNR19_000006 [Nocardioides thalensis]|uniref:Peptidase S8/S53 domain-containing protein n=1 Tax=Nocardioides thalensis TaxID=1914755 RepID=A0A853BXY1_9ACTN|nr:S8/S53 family peptidase [Nocardioides thalensis]NYI99307.1 hypothetical protein [Nocardioides thalensis]
MLSRLRLPWDWIRGGSNDESTYREEEVLREKRRAQVGVVRRALDGQVAAAAADGPGRVTDDADLAFLYRPGHAIVRNEAAFERVFGFFGQRQEIYTGNIERVPERSSESGILVTLPARRDGLDDVLATLDEIDDAFERGSGADAEVEQHTREHPLVTPDHLLYVTGYIRPSLCPATEPEMVRTKTPWPPQNPDDSVGKDIRVSVVDTGLWKGALTHPATDDWMDGVDCAPKDEEHVDPLAIHEYAGHGTFVSGVIQCLAPGSTVDVEGLLTKGGAVFEKDICEQLHDALESKGHPQVISISAGTYTRKNMSLLGFQMLAAAHGLDDGEETLVVAAAGNDNTDEPFYPAAFEWVTAVGSVDANGKRSKFSNYGDWVDVYARGSNLVNAFPEGTYKCVEPPNVGQIRTFRGLARWSGTSFSTPIVSGLIAARMSAAGENVIQARDAVLGAGTAGGTDPDGNPIRIVGPLT